MKKIQMSAALLLMSLSLPCYSMTVACLGRIEPSGEVLHLSGPSGDAGVISELRVVEGVWVTRNQVLAILDNHDGHTAEMERIQVELRHAEKTLSRQQSLSRGRAISESALESAKLAVAVNRARLAAAEAQLERSVVRAPIAGQVLQIHTREGERIDEEHGVLELAATDRMYTIAEVYETDIGRVQPGQRALIESPALDEPLQGTVERVGLKVGKMDVLDTDPVATTDARVIEVAIRLDDSEPVAGLTHLQVDVEIMP